jgi:hypothetical protein
MPRLESCFFGDTSNRQWTRLADVLRFTAARHCPTWDRRVVRVTPVPRVSAMGVLSHAANTQKMDEWHRLITESKDGEEVLLIDSDTMILRPLDDVWNEPFDMAYTTKEQSRFPFNSGVVFFRVSDRVRAFVDGWHAENLRMLKNRVYHQDWRRKYGGINQASLGSILHRNAHFGLTLLKLPCSEWNCEDSSWATFNPDVTRIVHIKSALRRAVIGPGVVPRDYVRLVKVWRGLEAEASMMEQTG